MTRKTLKVIFFALILAPTGAGAGDDVTTHQREFTGKPALCQPCHHEGERPLPDRQAGADQACAAFCRTCHTNLDRHHRTGMALDGKPPAGLLLREDRRVDCITCHNLRTSRFDRRPWRAQSLFARYFRQKTVYPTYYLIQPNDRGQLCRKCH